MSFTDMLRTTPRLLAMAAAAAAFMAACGSGPGAPTGSGGGAGSGAGGAAQAGTIGSGGAGGSAGSGGAAAGTAGTAGVAGASGAAGATSRGGMGGAASAAGVAGTMGAAGTGAAGTGGHGDAGSNGTPGAGGNGAQAGGGRGGGAGAAGSGGSGGAAVMDAGAPDRPDGSARPARVLLYTFSTLDIPSVPAQLTIFKQKLEGWQYQVDQSKDPAVFTDANLARYAAVGMINTCFYPFGANNAGSAESQALQRFLQAGGGLFGTHCADVTFQSVNPPPLYNQLIGGRANSDNFTGDNACRKLGDHPTIAALPATFNYNGNLDNAAFVAADSVVLVKCKFGGGSGADTAVSWVRNEGPGRVFFTSFGKVDKDLTDATIGDKHIVAGLGWVLGR